MKRKDHLKDEDVKDPEKAMQKDKEKKRKAALNPFKVSREEFTAWFVYTHGAAPNWTHPSVAWMFAGWVAGEGEREWLTEEEKAALVKKKEANLKRAAKAAENKRLKEETAAKLAAARKKVSKKK
jgi:hypothetical protein